MVSLRSLLVLLTVSVSSASPITTNTSPSITLITILPPTSSTNPLTIPRITLTPPDIPRVTITHHQPTKTKKTKTTTTSSSSSSSSSSATTTSATTSTPAHPARHCDYAYCDAVGTSWCFFFVPFTTIDPTKGPMPGETRSSIGPCGPNATASDGV